MNDLHNLFHFDRPKNQFDNLAVEVQDLYVRQPISQKINPKPNLVPLVQSPFHQIYRLSFLPLVYRRYLWYAAKQTHLDLNWFREFRSYWASVLKGRPLWSVHDLFFLKNLYRLKFSTIQVPDTTDPAIHLEAWQQPELLYQLLHLVTKEVTIDQFYILKQLQKYKKNVTSFLEYGCGTAPIATAFFEFHQPKQNFQAYICDIQTLAFHYASYKFRHCANVQPILLSPENAFQLQLDQLGQSVEVIFCMTVFEHLNDPLQTTEIFYDRLNQGGLLFFDYILSEGSGLDTHEAVRQRENVLDFMRGHFEVLYGALSKEQSMDLTILRKNKRQ